MILVDSCVLIDVFELDPRWHEWSVEALHACQGEGLMVNAVIYAEIAPSFADAAHLQVILQQARIGYSDISPAAAWRASRAFGQYRQNKGLQKMVLPDFFIGAQAEASTWSILTRDQSRFSTYFPSVRLITPDSVR
jgi:predicted nucleic acid-binding protein